MFMTLRLARGTNVIHSQLRAVYSRPVCSSSKERALVCELCTRWFPRKKAPGAQRQHPWCLLCVV